ncbi:MAG: M13 family metallopeptidase [Pseudomonadota bacterium]
MPSRPRPLNLMTALGCVLAGVLCWAQAMAADTTVQAATQEFAPGDAPAPTAPADVPPGDDFYQFANGDWLRGTPIPADRATWGAFSALAEQTNERIVQLIEQAAGAGSPEATKVSDYYRAYMDEGAIEARGMAPLKPLLRAIDALADKGALARALGASLRADVDPLNATDFFTENLFGLWVAQGVSDPAHHIAYLLQGGLGMPDRAYYLTASADMAALREQYQRHVTAMLSLAGYADAAARAARVVALERRIAAGHASRVESADVAKANNLWRGTDFATRAPGLDWRAFFRGAGLADQSSFMVWHPGAVTASAALVRAVPLATWKDYLAFHTINRMSAALPRAVVDQRFAFYGRALSDTPRQAPRWKRALAATNDALPDAVGTLYVARYFPPESKRRVQAMVDHIVAAFSRRIAQLAWMAPATKAQAQEKLRTLYVGVGYPERWRSYQDLKVTPDDAFGNALRAERHHTARELAKLGAPVDRARWAMPAQLVNAVNLPLQNALNFPAAMLQPPFFDPAAGDAVNYGAIGAIIGHEISHSFDDQGARFDAQGRLRDWWSAADLAHFKAAAAALAAQYAAYRPFPDLAVNGELTLSENLADLAGLTAAYDAFQAAQAPAGAALPDQQAFFLAFARSWRGKARDAAARQQILTDSHAPPAYRGATVRNLDAWYRAFDVRPGQALYLAPERRVRVW